MGLFDSFKKAVNSLTDDFNATQNQQQVPPQQNYCQQTPIPPVPPQQNYYQQAPMPPVPPQPAPAAQGDDMYNPMIEKLINIALADGELTEKEKQVLFKKAEAAGIDLDEFEMVLEARLFEIQKNSPTAAAQAASTAAPKSDKFGDIKKCPSCGAIIQTYTLKCLDCGFEFRNDNACASIQQLFDHITAVDADRREIVGRWCDDEDDIEDAEERQEERLTKRKVQVISQFPIPTSRENIIEFLTQAVPLSKAGFFADSNTKMLAKAWKSKCEQIIMKAKFTLKDDKELFAEITRYANELKIKL